MLCLQNGPTVNSQAYLNVSLLAYFQFLLHLNFLIHFLPVQSLLRQHLLPWPRRPKGLGLFTFTTVSFTFSLPVSILGGSEPISAFHGLPHETNALVQAWNQGTKASLVAVGRHWTFRSTPIVITISPRNSISGSERTIPIGTGGTGIQ